MKNIRDSILLALVFVLALAVIVVKPAKDRYVKVIATAVPKSVSIYVSAEVLVGTETHKGQFLGSGVFISNSNHVLTCAHVVDAEKVLGIMVCNSDGTCTAADILEKDKTRDLALLKTFFDEPTPGITLADPRGLRVGQEVLAIGNPIGLDFSVCHGIISALNRDIGWFYNLTQSDTMIAPGNSGGPLVNLDGELVGINNCILLVVPFIPINNGLSFSIQPGQIIEFVTKVRKQYEGLPSYNREYFK